MSKTMCFAGVSRVAGVLKFRGAQNANRITQLRKLGDTDVEMLYLGREMTKSEAAKELLSRNFANGRSDIEALLVANATDDNPFKAPRTVKIKAKGLKISKAAAEADDVPMSAKEARKIRAQFNARVREAYEAN